MKQKTLWLVVERSDAGLFIVTSPDVAGLLVAERSFEDALKQVPIALADLIEAARLTPPPGN